MSIKNVHVPRGTKVTEDRSTFSRILFGIGGLICASGTVECLQDGHAGGAILAGVLTVVCFVYAFSKTRER